MLYTHNLIDILKAKKGKLGFDLRIEKEGLKGSVDHWPGLARAGASRQVPEVAHLLLQLLPDQPPHHPSAS